MSTSSIKPDHGRLTHSPPDEEKVVGSQGLSNHRIEGGVGDRSEPGASHGNEDGSNSTTVPPPMSYPVDENLFDTGPKQPIDAEDTGDEPEYQEPAVEELVHPPDFRAFFTLIEDPETGEHQHPTVHYIFADDDADVLTSTLLDTLDIAESNVDGIQPTHEARDRHVIVDIAADGKTIISASSISADWQAINTSITQAPSWGEDNNSTDRALMLKISGRYTGHRGAYEENKRRQEQSGNIDELVKTYGERLERLDDVLSAK